MIIGLAVVGKKNSGGDNASSGNRHGLQLRDRKKPTLMKTQKCVCPRNAFVVSESREGSSFQAVLGLQSRSVLWTDVPETSLEQSQEALSGDRTSRNTETFASGTRG